MQRQRRQFYNWLFVSILFLFAGCQKEKNQYSTIQLYLKDSPAYVDSLLIRIYAVELISDSSNYRQKVFVKSPNIINILRYTNEKDTLLAKLNFDANFINKIAITFGSTHELYRKGNRILLTLSDTIKIFSLSRKILLKKTEPNKLYIDFDCYFSLKKKKKDDWQFMPVVKLRNADSTGSVRGKLKTGGKIPFVWLVSAFDTISTRPLSDGFFHILHVPAGEYSLWLSVEDEEGEETEEEPVMILRKVEVEAMRVTGVGTLLIN
ncbi:MAG: DUF4382 domain-containing protein [Bacteroidales bacterium]|nr:DUF4382 domain-containing protein [Bacteroidales bacterium]